MATFCLVLALLGAADPRIQRGQELLVQEKYQQAWVLLAPLAEQGNPEAQYLLGHMLDLGLGTNPDAPSALGWFLKAAEQGHQEAALRAGLAYLEGRGVDPDPEKGVAYLERAAAFGYHPGELALGKALLLGALGEGHGAEAVRWLACAADGGDGEAAEILGVVLANGTPEIARDLPRAVRYLQRAQKAGRTAAAQLLAQLDPAREVVYATEQNVHLLWEAARLGFPDAQFRLAVLGLANVPWGPKREEAKKLMEQAAAGGHPEACYRLLQLWTKEGKSVPAAERERLLRQAAEGGFSPAAFELGQLLAARGSPEALRWLRAAQAAGDVRATLELAQLYFEGKLLPQDSEAAVRELGSLVEHQDPLLRKRAAHLLLRFAQDRKACELAQKLDPTSACPSVGP